MPLAEQQPNQESTDLILKVFDDPGLLRIFSFFGEKLTLSRAARVCRRFNQIAKDNSLQFTFVDYKTREPEQDCQLRGHERWVTVLTTIETLDSWRLISGSEDGTVRIWDGNECEKTLNLNEELFETHPINCIATLPNNQLAIGGNGFFLNSLGSDEIIALGDKSPTAFAVMPLQEDWRLVVGFQDRSIEIWNMQTRQCERVIPKGVNSTLFENILGFLCIPCEQGYSFLSHTEHEISIWKSDCEEGVSPIQTVWQSLEVICSLVMINNGKHIAIGAGSGNIYILSAIDFSSVRTIKHSDGKISNLTVHPDTQQLIAGTGLGFVDFWNTSTWECEVSFRPDGCGMSALTILPNRNLAMAFHNSDKSIQIAAFKRLTPEVSADLGEMRSARRG